MTVTTHYHEVIVLISAKNVEVYSILKIVISETLKLTITSSCNKIQLAHGLNETAYYSRRTEIIPFRLFN